MRYAYLDMPDNEQDNQNPQGETNLGLAGRTLARTGARAAESILGAPGNIGQAVRSAVDLLPSILPQISPKLTQLQAGGASGPRILPTSEQIKENVTQPVAGQYLEPQSETEKFYDEVISDAAPMFASYLIGGPTAGIARTAAKSLGISAAGNTAKLATELVTGSPLAGSAAKLGTVLLAGTAGTRGSMEKLQKSSYNDAFSNIPLGQKFNVAPEAHAINNALKKVMRSDIVGKPEVVDRFNAFKNIVNKRGQADIKEIVDMKRAWNEYLKVNGRKLGNDSRKVIETARDSLKTAIERYGKTNPKFWKPYSAGEEITSGLRDIDDVSSFLGKYPYLQKKMESPILSSLFKGSAFHSGKLLQDYPAQVAGGLGAILGVQSGAKAIKLMANSPIAFRAYKDAVQNALKGNAANFGRDLDRIQKEYDKNSSVVNGRYVYLDQ